MLTEQTLNLILIGLGLLGGAGFGWFAVLSVRERELRAARISGGLAILFVITFYFSTYFAINIKLVLFYIILGLITLAVILFFLPIGTLPPDQHAPTRRFDERKIMFARHRLKPGTPEYEQYYALYPEDQSADDRTRARPGLQSPDSKFAHRPAFAATEAGFQLTETMHPMVDGSPSADKHPFTPQEAAAYVKKMALLYGAADVGITPLNPAYVYSHVGRGPGEYGSPIELDHPFAIAFTVEMDFEAMQSAPQGTSIIETAHQYVEAGKISVQLAETIRQLGYEARAHMDGNYRVICPPVARDAGLGEIGRMSLLMTMRLGPRVRLGVVTTTLPLETEPTQPSPEMIDFCLVCKKCAENCPSKSIPFGPRTEEDGVLRWRINPETCFAYWNEIGTDCGICMAVCPYAHPDHPLHNAIRWGNARSGTFRRAALWLDDLFYGKHPERKPLPEWLTK
ncbi:MAG TPA: 4Fe-4S dicluster domain-containing protein [Anaerolineales bacterium]|nr:4Fe-4S dicluster domain-containing protein [Anaerolineales bacterium]